MEHMRASSPDTLQLVQDLSFCAKPLTSSKLKVLSYEKGSYNRGSVTISKYPDGTIVLDDGKNRVVQRPRHMHAIGRATSVIEKIKIFFSDLARKLFI